MAVTICGLPLINTGGLYNISYGILDRVWNVMLCDG